MKKQIALTGIKPTGDAHLGNYLGAIKPALELVKNYEARYFIADYHALNTMKDPKQLKKRTYEIAATWLAFGLDPEKVIFYKQSDIPEIFELTTLLMAYTPKGLMNRAHAYKAAIAENIENKKDNDSGVNMGLFTYPVLMSSDILLFDTNLVPVGKDQKQHIEIAADIAQTINNHYNKELLIIPQPLINEKTPLITGLDGRKMSKSYNNVIPLFLPSKKLRKLIMKIVTNSQGVEEAKDPDSCNIFKLYKLFSTEEEQEVLKNKYLAGGMGWGVAKQILFEKIDQILSPYRERYSEILENTSYIDKVLKEGAIKSREIASKTLSRVKKGVGLL